MEKKFVANKAFLVNAQGKILFVRDSGGTDHTNSVGRWDAPGGRMDVGETPLEGLKREILEETGILLDETKAKPFHVDLWGIGGDSLNQPIVGIFYAVLVGDVEVRLSDEHTEFIWFDPKQNTEQLKNDSVRHALEAYRSLEGIVVADDCSVIGHEGFGLIQLFTGNGKGKTTAATGEMMRAIGAGKKVGVVYFDKGGESHYFERSVLQSIGVTVVPTGRDRIDANGRFDFSIQQIDKDEAMRGLQEVQQLFDQKFDLVVMDEINSTTDLGMVSIEDVLELIERKPEQTELVLTGRNAPQAFIDLAHLMTEMRLRKHYFYSGVKAREGIDY